MSKLNLLVVFILLLASSCKNADEIKARALVNAEKVNKTIVKAELPKGLGKVHKSSVTEFKKALDDNIGILVDIRTPEEYTKGHLANAVNINFKKRTFPLYITAIAKDKPVLIYCRSGNRSGKAALLMQALGFKEIYDLAKGFKGWNAEKQPITIEDNEATKKLQNQFKSKAHEFKAIVGKEHQVGVNEFEKLVKENKVTLVDVRTAKEFAEGHIAGAINIDWKNRHFAENAIKNITNEKPVAIYCRSGNRATKAMYVLGALGFNEVYNLDKGIKSWKKANKPLKTLEVKGDIRHLDTKNFNNAILGQKGKLVDVRTPKEYNNAHIPGAIMIDYNGANFKNEFTKLDKNVPVLIYCRSGRRSSRAMKVLEGMGFTVYNLDKGFLKWKEDGMKIEGNHVNAKDVGEEGC